MSSPTYQAARDYFQKLPESGLVVFIGYHQCPYTEKVKDLISSYELDDTFFHGIERSQGPVTKSALGNQSFPIVFARGKSGRMVYVGGANELADVLDNRSRE
jgi:hypothetical protein